MQSFTVDPVVLAVRLALVALPELPELSANEGPTPYLSIDSMRAQTVQDSFRAAHGPHAHDAKTIAEVALDSQKAREMKRKRRFKCLSKVDESSNERPM